MFDIPAEARLRGLDEPELMHIVFEHGVSEGLRLAECQRGQERACDRLDENVFDIPAIARSRGRDEHELTHMVLEFGEEEGMRMMEKLSLEDDASSVVFHGGVVQEPRVCLALDELLPVSEVRQACEAPEPAKSVRILFRGQHGLGVWKLAAEQSLAEWYSVEKLEAVEALKTLLGQGVGTQVVELIQEHIPPPPQVTPPGSPSESERAQHHAKLLDDKLKLDKSIQEGVERVSKARLVVAVAEDDLSILQQELKGLVTLTTGKMMHGGRGVGVGMMLWRVLLLRRRIVVRRLGSRRRVAKRGRWARVGLAARLLELLRGTSEEDHDTFKRNMGRMDATCPLWRVTILQLVFVLKIRMKRRVFEIFKPGRKFLRSAFFVGSGTRKDGHFNNEDAHFFGPVFPKSLVSRCGETISQVPESRLSCGRGYSAGCEDNF